MVWRIGQKVVSLVDFPNTLALGFSAPVKNGVYTIRTVDWDGSLTGLRFEEVVNTPCLCRNAQGTLTCEINFLDVKFRPLVESEANISVFTKILDEVNSKVPEKVV